MANGIRTGEPRGFNKGRSSKFRVGSRVRQTPEEDRRTYQPKRCKNNTKDEDNSPKTLNDKNHQASSKKFRQHKFSYMVSSIPFEYEYFVSISIQSIDKTLTRITTHGLS